jgi:hypothetical protein
MKKLKFTLLFILIVVFSSSFAQENSWINYSQSYYKIPIHKKGVYRISYQQLVSAGINVTTINPLNVQIFAKGKELPIYIQGENDGVFNSSDYIEFIIDNLNADLDTKLFSKSIDQGNPYISMFSDTINCFLTWNNSTNNKRMEVETDVNFTNYTPLNYCMYEVNMIHKNQFSGGVLTVNGWSVPEYSSGEGYLGANINHKQTRNYTLNTPFVYANGPDATLETRIYGRSRNLHKTNVLIENNLITDSTFNRYNGVEITKNFTANILKTNTIVSYSNQISYTNGVDRTAVSYTKITYPRTFNFGNENEMWFQIQASNSAKDYVIIENFNSNNSTVRIYDLDAAKRIVVQPISGTYRALIPNFNNEARRCLITSDFMVQNVSSITPVGGNSTRFVDYSELALQINEPNYIIITHTKLLDAAQQYAQYRNQRGFKTLVLDIEQLYLQHAWGVRKHPYAIRSVILEMFNKWNIQPQYLFIIGKSVNASIAKNNRWYELNLVPTWGVLGADAGFTSGLQGTQLEPSIPTGRIAANTPEEVLDYLEKIKQHESNTPAEWMKNILHFGGGQNSSEQNEFKKYLEGYQSTAEVPFFGGKIHTFLKNSSAPLQINLSDSVTNLINNGVTLMTFFGHAYGSNFDQSIDEPENYKNTGKYPFLIANSCLIGNIHTQDTKTGSERFVLAKQKGSIGFLGSSSLGVTTYLNQYTSAFYRHFANLSYGKSIGEIVQNTIKDIQVPGNELSRDVCLHMTLHGDPAIIMNTFPKPDYSIVSSDINSTPQVYTSPKIITTEIDSFDLHVIVSNIGKAQNDTFGILINRIFNDGKLASYSLTKTVNNIFYKDTFVFRFPVDVLNGVGENKFEIKIDVNNEIDEISENNNNFIYPVYIESSDINPVFPYEFAIISDYLPVLKASTGKAYATLQNYILEIDTSFAFDSPIKLTITKQSTGGVIEWSPEVFPELKTFFQRFNSTNQLNTANVFFWRVAKVDNLKWRASSFQYVEDKSGWGQANWGQFNKNNFDFMSYQFQPKTLNFIEQIKTLEINTNGVKKNNFNEDNAFKINFKLNGTIMSMTTKTHNSLTIGVIDKKSLLPWHSQNSGNFGHNNYQNRNYEPTWNSYSFEFILPGSMQNIINFLNAVPDSNYIFMYNYNYHNLSNSYKINNEDLRDEFINLMKSLGSNVDSITKYPNNYPYIFFTQKGNSNKSKEITTNFLNDYIQLVEPLKNNWLDGSMYSTKIGPGKNWKSLHWEVQPDELDNLQDTTQLFLYGLEDNGTTVLLLDTIAKQGDVLSLENLNIQQYKELQLQYYFVDPKERTPSKPIRWQVVHDEIPELALNALKISNYTMKDTLQQGESLYFVTAIQNISNVEMPAFSVQNWIVSNTSAQNIVQSKMMKNLAPGEVIFDTVYVETKDLQGLNSLWYEVNPKSGEYEWQTEKYHYNNTNLFSFFIKTDKINPVLDVAFDGIRILNGDIVSANPEIVITLNDENPFLKLDNPSLMQVFIKYPANYGDSTVLIPESAYDFIPASGLKNEAKIVFKHKFHNDGKYELGIMAMDKSRNISGKGHAIYDLKIQFEIVTKSTITQLLNYPNPFSTSTRFVFVLTGEQIPDEIRIQIMSVTGKVVREINQDELGPINIGRNITEFAWDGKDQFGDQLANGVYFYRVIVKNNGEIVEERQQNINNASIKGNMSDKLFKQGYGKMYLMR